MKTILSQKPASSICQKKNHSQRATGGIFSRLLFSLLVLFAATLHANQATIVAAEIVATEINLRSENHSFRINVTISHADEGWDHYANRWDIFDENGNLLGTRVLHHPHENEQPFTRSLSLVIPPGVKTITIVASDSVHKANPETLLLPVPGRSK